MSFPVPTISTSQKLAVGVAAASFGVDMPAGNGEKLHEFVCTTDCWIKQGAAPTASAASGSMFVPALRTVLIDAGAGVKLSVIRNTADGSATLTLLRFVR